MPSYFGGLWHLYYAGSSFGSNNSVIGLATTPTLDPRSPRYHWTDDGLVFRTTSADNFNAIDPSLVTAADGGKWLVLGSFFSGIKMIQLDAATGKPAASPTVYSLASKPFPDPEEGPGSPTTTATTTCSSRSTTAAGASAARTTSRSAGPRPSPGPTSTRRAPP